MKTQITTTKNFLVNAFTATFNSTADNQQKAVVFVILFIPLMTAALIFGHFPKY